MRLSIQRLIRLIEARRLATMASEYDTSSCWRVLRPPVIGRSSSVILPSQNAKRMLQLALWSYSFPGRQQMILSLSRMGASFLAATARRSPALLNCGHHRNCCR
eukprot:6179324-Pleurochrysis_carterae.AAC.1